MRINVKYYFLIAVFIFLGVLGYEQVTAREYIDKGREINEVPSEWNPIIAESINKKDIKLYIDGVEVVKTDADVYMDKSMNIMVPTSIITDKFDCAVCIYSGGYITVERGNNKICMYLNALYYTVNDDSKQLEAAPLEIGNDIYVPLDCIIDTFGYTYNFNVSENKATLINDNPSERKLPYAYCYRDIDKLGNIRDQGYRGTCWAMATVAALESRILPYDDKMLSVDHMTMNNSFKTSQYDGGDYSMALAYLVAWQGPVLEADDPYGDDVTVAGLRPVKHVQEVQMIPSKDLEAIKMMVYKYGGVSTSLYTSLTSSDSSSKYYNKKTASYCYIGEAKPNHEVVIVGWDDNYPKENFNTELAGNGAFICQNSWGTDFGDEGLFYVSYYDTNIGLHNVVYTGVEEVNNYGKIYQSDLCGWRGNLGYEKESAYFANVYQTTANEELKAVSFYAVDGDTYYEVYVVKQFNDERSFNKKKEVLASGTLKYAGYYTIDLEKSISLEPGEKYAVIVYISTPNATRPVAVELKVDYKTSTVTLSDGEGYISYTGKTWENVEEKYGCNICLKAFTNYK